MEAATSSSSKIESKLEFSGFWLWESEMERLGQWPGLSEAFEQRVLESRGNNNHARSTQANSQHTPSVLRR